MCYKMSNPTMVFLLAILLTGCILHVSSRPNEKSPGATTANNQREEGYEELSERDYERIKPCIQNMGTMELCMRCAKVTKSPIVYPMCCSNEDKVFDWCTEYIYYGSTS